VPNKGFMEIYKSKMKESPVRTKIFLILLDDDGLTISEIFNVLEKRNDKYNYRTIWQHIQTLEKQGEVITKKEEHEPGKPVRVFLSPVIKEYRKELREEFRNE